MTARESHLVELVSLDGRAIGSDTVFAAHQAPGRLHRAFSVFLRDATTGRVLLQQRAAVKTRFPLRWANTCCGHPLPGEDLAVAARRRLAEELGLPAMPLRAVGVHTYRAEDPESGRVEHEYDHVLVGDLPVGVRPEPDPDEVAGLRWVSVPGLLAELSADPRPFAPWLLGVATRLAEHQSRLPSPRSNASSFTPVPPSGTGVNDDAPERSGGR
ncbi:isopentenyl-diphosphate Delta-isomerase [Paractinoplanes durhamensis]|uniref:Isopentenyl-diphosphate Delta-isomerase n=1 Tax=Paractinoplanes durhamensis TaxID=113563 RepID=A0ABQ3ZE43_9ACTN|nr:isopentenyl-diphosphate Delta-isomerase [Actinoplanes durhamensis]GIE08108.1 isopentenyl-diphosphate Delta-isomerase [Actinoplanes durhamensis]